MLAAERRAEGRIETRRMASEELKIEVEAGVATLLLHRPERKNALNRALVLELTRALSECTADPEIQVIVLRGAGGAFCSGADLSSIVDEAQTGAEARLDEFHGLIWAIFEAAQPVVAALEGPAAGFGADLALSCDLRIAAESAYLQESFVHVGLMPDGGSSFFLPAFVGFSKAFEILSFGERLNSKHLLELGLVSACVPALAFDGELSRLTSRLRNQAPLALRAIKRALRANQRDSLEQALARERAGQLQLLRTQDFVEGVGAFRDKRIPRFRGE